MSGPVLIEEGVAVRRAPSKADRICPACGIVFTPKRSNQTYCEPPCQKRATRNAARGSQKAADNPDAARLAELHRRRAMLLVDALYSLPPAQRPAFMETILTAAREHDWHLRRILTDRRAVTVFTGHPGTGRPTLARALDDYCQRTRNGARIWHVVAKAWTDDPTLIHPLALYRDPWTDAEPDLEGPSEVHVRRDPEAFLAGLRAMRRVADESHTNPPSCSYEGPQEVTLRDAELTETALLPYRGDVGSARWGWPERSPPMAAGESQSAFLSYKVSV